jgi:LysM repeat protein
MSTPNPLAPQGSLLEKHGRGRSTFQIISFIGAIHVVALCGLLWIGCKKDDQAGGLGSGTGTGTGTGLDANPGGLGPVGGDVALPPVGGNLPGYGAAPITNPPTPGYVGGPVAPPPPVVASNPPTGIGQPLQPMGTVVAPPPPLDPVPTPAPTTAAGEYKVQKGDFGTTIAKKAGVSLAALKAANPGVDWNKLKLNQVLNIPAATSAPAPTTGTGYAPTGTGTGTTVAPTTPEAGNSYVVRPGDTGSKIAKKTGVSWKSIRAASGLSSDSIRPGQKLTIPAKGSASTAPSGTVPTGGPAPLAPVPSGPTATPLPPLPGQ